MSENAQWYYTDKNGKQAGPVSETELKDLIAQSTVTESSMVWCEGMANWTQASQVEKLLPAKSDTPEPTPSVTASKSESSPTSTSESSSDADVVDPYTTPQTTVSYEELHGLEREYGGCGRLAYFFKVFITSIILFAGVFFIAFSTAFSGEGAEPSLIVIVIMVVVFLILYIRFALQRIRNIGASGWWLLLMFVPLASNLLSIALLACPKGYADHKKMDTAGIVVAVIAIGLFLLSLAGNFLTVLAK